MPLSLVQSIFRFVSISHLIYPSLSLSFSLPRFPSSSPFDFRLIAHLKLLLFSLGSSFRNLALPCSRSPFLDNFFSHSLSDFISRVTNSLPRFLSYCLLVLSSKSFFLFSSATLPLSSKVLLSPLSLASSFSFLFLYIIPDSSLSIWWPFSRPSSISSLDFSRRNLIPSLFLPFSLSSLPLLSLSSSTSYPPLFRISPAISYFSYLASSFFRHNFVSEIVSPISFAPFSELSLLSFFLLSS